MDVTLMHKNNIFFMVLIAAFSYNFSLQADQINFHEEFNSVILKNIQPENPSKEDKKTINLAKALHDFGSCIQPSNQENWHTLQSVDFFSILAKHNHTKTSFGLRMLQQQAITGMTDDLSTLKFRQKCIEFLSQNPKLVENLSKPLTQSIDGEEQFLELFEEKNQSTQNLYFSNPWLLTLNEDSTAMEISARLSTTLPIAWQALDWICMPIATHAIIDIQTNYKPNKFTKKDIPGVIARATYKSLVNIKDTPKLQVEFFKKMYGASQNVAIGLTTTLTLLKIYNLYLITMSTKNQFDIIYQKQQSLINISNAIKSLKELHHTFEENQQLANAMPAEYAKLTELFDTTSTKTSLDLKILIQNLLSSSFNGTGSYLFSQQGKILAIFHALNRIKGELIPYFEVLGQIDAYLAIVALFEQFKNHENAQFCLPEYINNQTPIFIAKDFWHPLLDAQTVICNDLQMGQNQTNANLIITGPNAGGKTTSMTALIINLIFAQSYGIAPCSSLQITPFAKIHSSLDITTNLKDGLSLFAAEVDRAKKLNISIISCNSNQKTFTIIDELFTGTSEEVAADIGAQFATKLGNMHHSMMIITTHIKNLTKLEKETGRFTNYKVADANIDQNGNITYPFKLIKGISDQNIAALMLKQNNIL